MANVLPIGIFELLGFNKNLISPTRVKLQSYTGGSLKVIGKCLISCQKYFFVVNSNTQAILGLNSCIKLNLIKKIESVKSVDYSELIEEYKELFTGIGCINSTYHIDIKENAEPVAHPTRRVALP